MSPNPARVAEAAPFWAVCCLFNKQVGWSMSIISGHWERWEKEGGYCCREDEAREEQSEKTVGVSESVCVCACVCLLDWWLQIGPNGFQKGSHNKHEGNQTVEITTRCKHRIKNMPAGLLAVLYPITQLKNNMNFFSLFST